MSFASFIVKLTDKVLDRTWNNYHFPDIEEIKDIVYDEDNAKACMLDIYRKKTEGKQPVFFNIHGGSFVGGGRKSRRGFSRYIATLGYVVVNISYGLAPKHKYPENLKHAVAALRWVENNAEKYNFDTDRVVISGDSAGGYLASSLMGICVNKRVREKLEVQDFNIRPMAGVYYCGIYDMPYSLQNNSPLSMHKAIARDAFGITKITDALFEEYPYTDVLSPIDHIVAEYPPIFIAHSDKDMLCPRQGDRMIEKFKENNVKFWEFRATKKAKCIHCWHLTQSDPKAQACLDGSAKFLAALLKGDIENYYMEI
ncbi:MAG: alpha/beta hydrolase [Clostridia bacterium]